MNKQLEEMSLKDLGQLFPIKIVEHDPSWAGEYGREKMEVEAVVGRKNIVRISHIGSTRVPGLVSKPTIDILLEITGEKAAEKLVEQMRSIGYLFTPQPDNPPPRMMFMKGYTLRGYEGQAFHLHARYAGDWDELYFRDYLLSRPDVAREYGELKLRLKAAHENDREAYTAAKTDFIKNATAAARALFGDRYR